MSHEAVSLTNLSLWVFYDGSVTPKRAGDKIQAQLLLVLIVIETHL